MDYSPRRARNDDDNLIPLINIVFLLLIFFMVAGQIQPQPDASIQVPVSNQDEPAYPLSVFVSLDADGGLTFSGQAITHEALVEHLRQNDDLQEIAIVADERATAAQLESLLADFRQRDGVSVRIVMEQQP